MPKLAKINNTINDVTVPVTMRVIIVLFLLVCCLMKSVLAQGDLVVLPERGLFAGYSNAIKLVKLPDTCPQPELVGIFQNDWWLYQNAGGPRPVLLELKHEYGAWHVRPEMGVVNLVARLGSRYDTLGLDVNPLPATIFLGNYSGQDPSINRRVVKEQRGLIAEVLNLNINLRCSIKAYELTIACEYGKQSYQVAGSRFSEEIVEAIQLIQPGDLIIFRQIRYQCPGADVVQYAPNMVFEVK
ncbi:GldM family protein [Neolewinella persica]|uniref:GldM family protein n=1 Tax=Neolewinella persica TaxID=70998 RepID=UPI00036570F3|nr:GldM family protein [Neolewinella persica]